MIFYFQTLEEIHQELKSSNFVAVLAAQVSSGMLCVMIEGSSTLIIKPKNYFQRSKELSPQASTTFWETS